MSKQMQMDRTPDSEASAHSWADWPAVIGLILLMILPRLTALNQYLIVDETDRWLWAKDFVGALSRGDLAGTLVGDGYPGIVPVWAETIWVLLEAGRRSLVEGQWLGDTGLAHLLHEWDRNAMLMQQRLPIVLLNTALALAIVWAVWRLFGKRTALVSGLLIALDPFYLSDSRVNRAEAVITGLMTLSMLYLIFYYRRRHFRYVLISGVLGGLSFLTKIQALVILPVVALAGFLIYVDPLPSIAPRLRGNGRAGSSKNPGGIRQTLRVSFPAVLKFGAGWAAAACLTWLVLWPSMWVTPLETLTLVFNYTTRKVGAEGVNLFFLGQTYRDTAPGILFYPVVFFMRITPLALLGLAGAAFAGVRQWQTARSSGRAALPGDPFAAGGGVILVVYVLLYALIMTVGSHKQDRYLMPVFLGLDILAAMGLVYGWVWLKQKVDRPAPPVLGWILLAGLAVIQAATVLPHHPYYYSYFNPLFGGGQTAVRTLRIGWGEGMDQAGAYLAAKPNSENLAVGTRFGRNMLDFKGELLTLGQDGRWTHADYIVLYIQQVQRRLDPSSGFIDYFQARSPEKVITLGGIDYAWIYPIPFTTPANPQVSQVDRQAALLGYSWECANGECANDSPFDIRHALIRVLWENLGAKGDRQLVARLAGDVATGWTPCRIDPVFAEQARAPGAYVESVCAPSLAPLPPGLYTVEFGLTAAGSAAVEPFPFPEGRLAARITPDGAVSDTPAVDRLEAIVGESVPVGAARLDRIYDGRIRLAAYQIVPSQPRPGESLALTLYWQTVRESPEDPLQLTVQLADSRSISLGRVDTVFPPAGKRGGGWLPGDVTATRHTVPLAADLEGPLAGRVEIGLTDAALIPLPATDLSGQKLEPVIARFTVAPEVWPTLEHTVPVTAEWQSVGQAGDRIALRGYTVEPAQVQPGELVRVGLYWEADGSIAENYTVFVHLLDGAGQIRAQHDSVPRAGAYPTPWWEPGAPVEDVHSLVLPADLPGGVYQLRVGLYRTEDGARLPLTGGGDSFMVQTVTIR